MNNQKLLMEKFSSEGCAKLFFKLSFTCVHPLKLLSSHIIHQHTKSPRTTFSRKFKTNVLCQFLMLSSVKCLTPHNHHVVAIVWDICKIGVSVIRATTIDYYGLVIFLMRCHDASQLDRDLNVREERDKMV